MVRLCAAEGRSKQLLKRRFRCDRHFARIWVQLGCNKSSRGFLRAPKVAIGAVKLQSVTSGFCSVTAEVASSSLVVPAILSKRVRPLLSKPSRARKGRVSRPFCVLIYKVVWQIHNAMWQQFSARPVILRPLRAKRPVTIRRLVLHASPE
jgi:hypothetical protein